MDGEDICLVIQKPPPFISRVVVRTSVVAAVMLSRLPPVAIVYILEKIRRGARVASFAEALRAHQDVVRVSIFASRSDSCLPRSLAIILVSRARGFMPRWCVGIRQELPRTAHAWIEADGDVVGENIDFETMTLLFSVDDNPSKQVM
ncbi:lasso peptide biosynthesis B2 protein [Streptomyces rubiginosohelvolus]|uniref:lasso peptide biosynthesis B2 protein n=1 Tax=Streptomyces rubiginosohelvolus TaxID=67362 RepID=UPI0036A47AE4